jgi:hypothetical protein
MIRGSGQTKSKICNGGNVAPRKRIASPAWLFLRQWKVYVLPRFRHKTSTGEDARLKGSALILPVAFADIDIAKDRFRILNTLGVNPNPRRREKEQ